MFGARQLNSSFQRAALLSFTATRSAHLGPVSQVPPPTARGPTGVGGGSAGAGQHKATAIPRNNSQTLSDRRPSGALRTALCPGEVSFARTPSQLPYCLDSRRAGLSALSPEPLPETKDEKGGNDHCHLMHS